MSSEGGWIAFDLDGTLAVYDGWKGPTHIGEPIPSMVQRVKEFLEEGRSVKIFTARVSSDGSVDRNIEARMAGEAIKDWCFKHLGRELPVTNQKDYNMLVLYDDRCVQVEPNTGVIVGRE